MIKKRERERNDKNDLKELKDLKINYDIKKK